MPTEDKDTGKEPESESTPAPSYMTAEQFNKALSARDKRLMGTIEKLLADRVQAPAEPQEHEGDTPAKAKANGEQDATLAELKTLKKQLERERAARESAETKRQEQETRMARDEERAKLTEVLTAQGINPKLLRSAVALLHSEDKRIRRNDEGKIVFVDELGAETDLTTGVKDWAKTDEGKSYLAPRGASGSGAERGTATAPSNGRGSKAQQTAEADATLRRLFSGQSG